MSAKKRKKSEAPRQAESGAPDEQERSDAQAPEDAEMENTSGESEEEVVAEGEAVDVDTDAEDEEIESAAELRDAAEEELGAAGDEAVPDPDAISDEEKLPMLEALLFAAEEPLSERVISQTIPDTLQSRVKPLLDALEEGYERDGRGLTVQKVAGGYRLATRPEYADIVRAHLRGRIRGRLSRAALETASIVAYRQPVSRPEIEEMRGVDCSQVLRHLLERELIRVTGRAEAPGRPLLYGTTQLFLEYFGLNDLASLPKPEELLGELEEEDKSVPMRSGPFEGAGEGVEDESYRDNGEGDEANGPALLSPEEAARRGEERGEGFTPDAPEGSVELPPARGESEDDEEETADPPARAEEQLRADSELLKNLDAAVKSMENVHRRAEEAFSEDDEEEEGVQEDEGEGGGATELPPEEGEGEEKQT